MERYTRKSERLISETVTFYSSLKMLKTLLKLLKRARKRVSILGSMIPFWRKKVSFTSNYHFLLKFKLKAPN